MPKGRPRGYSFSPRLIPKRKTPTERYFADKESLAKSKLRESRLELDRAQEKVLVQEKKMGASPRRKNVDWNSDAILRANVGGAPATLPEGSQAFQVGEVWWVLQGGSWWRWTKTNSTCGKWAAASHKEAAEQGLAILENCGSAELEGTGVQLDLKDSTPITGAIPQALIPDPFLRIAEYMKRFDRGLTVPGTMLDRLCRYQRRCELGVWFIRDVHQKKVPLKPRLAQAMFRVLMFDQAAEGKPVRIRILKSRKTGISTDVQTMFVDFCTYNENQTAKTIAHEIGATRDIFRIGKYAAKIHDEDEDAVKIKILRHEIAWLKQGSEYTCATAGGTAVGAGSTPNLLHISEGPKHSQLNKKETRYNSTTAVPDVSETAIIEEFTAKGRDEYFISWSESAANSDHPYKSLFIPWFADMQCSTPAHHSFRRTEEEEGLVQRARRMGYALSNDQLEWRRRKIMAMPGGEVIFRQEYPSTPEEAVMGTEGLIIRNVRDCLVDELPFDESLCEPSDRVGGIDFGYVDPCVIWSGIYRDDILWLTHFYRKVRGLSRDHVRGLVNGTTYYCDPPERHARCQLIDEADRYGVTCRFAPAPRRKAPGEDCAAAELRMIADLISSNRLKILRSVSNQLLCETDTYVVSEKTGKPLRLRSEEVGHFDTIMALKYLVMGVVVLGRQEWSVPAPPREGPMTRREGLQASA